MDEPTVETATSPTGQPVEVVEGTEKQAQVVNRAKLIGGTHAAPTVTQQPQLTEADRQKKRNGGFGSRY